MNYPYGFILSWGVDMYIRPCIFLYINQNLGRKKPQASLLFGTSQKLRALNKCYVLPKKILRPFRTLNFNWMENALQGI
jgi:hypothetical protein